MSGNKLYNVFIMTVDISSLNNAHLCFFVLYCGICAYALCFCIMFLYFCCT